MRKPRRPVPITRCRMREMRGGEACRNLRWFSCRSKYGARASRVGSEPRGAAGVVQRTL